MIFPADVRYFWIPGSSPDPSLLLGLSNIMELCRPINICLNVANGHEKFIESVLRSAVGYLKLCRHAPCCIHEFLSRLKVSPADILLGK